MMSDIHRHESKPSVEEGPIKLQPDSEATNVRPRRFLLFAVLMAAALLIAALTHGYWLPLASSPLLARPIPQGFAPTVIWIHSGDGHSLPGQDTLNVLAELQHRHSADIVVTVGRRSRVVEIGALPPMDELIRQAAARRGIPADRVVGAPYRVGQLWGAAEWIRDYLKENPQARVLYLCEVFAGAATEHVFDCAFDDDCRGRVAVLEIPDRRFDARQWWRTRAGVKALMNGYLFGMHGLAVPHPPEPPEFAVKQLMDRFPPPKGGAP
ncbi:hypothetical protein [Thermopirellula anaerolimosa]